MAGPAACGTERIAGARLGVGVKAPALVTGIACNDVAFPAEGYKGRAKSLDSLLPAAYCLYLPFVL